MTKKINNKQKNKKIVLALVWNFLGIWCLEFVILGTKFQGRTGEL